MSDLIHAISDDTFENEMTGAKTPILVDFWAEWCGPCKALTPILEDIAKHYAGKIKIVKLNVDQNPATAAKFSVRGIPTLILFVEGKMKATQVGLMGKQDLIKFIDSHI